MLKKVITAAAAMSMLLCFAACGNETAPAETSISQSELSAEESAEGHTEAKPQDNEPAEAEESTAGSSEDGQDNEPAETEGPSSGSAAEEKRLDELIAQTNPSNKYEELVAANEICREQYDLAVLSIEKAGLSEDSTLSGLVTEWREQFGDLRNCLKEYENASQEELNALDEDAEFMYYADYFLPAFARIYNMTNAIAEDPALWLERYMTVPEGVIESIECDGSWPEGYFFSDRVPELEHVDELGMSATGNAFGFEDGVEYALYVNEFEEEQALVYIDQLIEMGFREETESEAMGAFIWFGRLNDSEGHISAAIMYDGNADGTAEDPAMMVQLYNYDIVGIMIDIGTIY